MKIVPAESRGPKPPRLTPREAAIERGLTRYFRLTCEHYTTYDVQLLNANRPHARGTYYCENCGDWKEKLKPPVYVIPDDPPY